MAQPLSQQPRAYGDAHVSVGADHRLENLRQSGSAKILIPKRVGPGLEAVLLNTAGGLTGGDRFAWRGEAGPGARLRLTTQAAERAYRAAEGVARVETHLKAAEAARIDWLPQETILYDGAALHRKLTIDLAEGSTCLAVETLIFGRHEMGETLHHIDFRDDWRISRAGKLIHAEAFQLNDIAALSNPAALNNMGAIATLLYVGPDADTLSPEIRADLPPTAGVSAFDNKLILRIMGIDGFTLRRSLAPLIARLADGLPKVWRL